MIQKLKTSLAIAESYIRAHPKRILAMVLGAAVLLALSRRPETIFMAQFWAEDGRYWYADAYNNGFSTLFSPYAGYFVVTYRLVALASLALPLHLAPIFFNMAALGLQLLPIVLLCSGRLGHIFRYRWIGVLAGLLYVCTPNIAEVFTNLTNIQWHLGVAAFLVLLAAPRKKWWWRIFDYGVLIATGLSGPLVILLLPLVIWQWWKHKTTYYRNLLVTASLLAALQLLSIFVVSGGERVSTPADPNLLYFIMMIAGQIFSGSLLGQANVDILYPSLQLLLMVFAGGVALLIYAFWKGPAWLRLAHIYTAFVIGAMLFSLRPVPGFDPWQGLTNPGGGQRYWYIPTLVWLATLAWLAVKAPARLVRGIAITAGALLLCVGIPADWRVQPWPYLDFYSHATHFEQEPSGAKVSIPINPGWDMVLIKK